MTLIETCDLVINCLASIYSVQWTCFEHNFWLFLTAWTWLWLFWLLLISLTWLWLLLTVIDYFDVVVVVAISDRFDVVVVVANFNWLHWRGCGCCWLLMTALIWMWLLLLLTASTWLWLLLIVIDRFDMVVVVADCYWPLWGGCGSYCLLLTALMWLWLLMTVIDRFDIDVVVAGCCWLLWHGCGCCWLLLTALMWLWSLLLLTALT